MDDQRQICNRFLVEVFDQILRTEEACLSGQCEDLSLRELHLIEEVCRRVDNGGDNRSTAIAAAHHVTAGTLTTAVSLLEKKGYLERRRDRTDRRAVRLFPTEKARRADFVHARFHQDMVDKALSRLSDREAQVLVTALAGLADFFREEYQPQERESEL